MKEIIVMEPTTDTPPAIRVFVKEGRSGRAKSRLFAEGTAAENVARAIDYGQTLMCEMLEKDLAQDPATTPAQDAGLADEVPEHDLMGAPEMGRP